MELDQLVKIIIRIVLQKLTASAKKKGHVLTQKLIKSFDAQAKKRLKAIVIEFYMENYGSIQNVGVPASRIPFSGTRRGSGSGSRRSKFILGLTRYARKRFGLSGKKALRAAFAMAHKMKKTGMQIRTGGKGTHWIDEALEMAEQEIFVLLQEFTEKEFDVTIRNLSNTAA